MNIYPAIDLRAGKCVRLYQGKYQCETIYHDNPLTMAKEFAVNGARWLHIVDLDGAKNPANNQASLIAEIINATDINVQTGGGIREQQQIEFLLGNGAKRIIIGSLAVQQPELVAAWLNYFGTEKIVLALDVVINTKLQPMIVTNAWQSTSEFLLYDLLQYYLGFNLQHLLCTNIALDGTMQGPDCSLYASILAKFPMLKLQASGGIHSVADVVNLRDKKLDGAIIGRALYENKFTLCEVLTC